jgi:hypothetical protein
LLFVHKTTAGVLQRLARLQATHAIALMQHSQVGQEAFLVHVTLWTYLDFGASAETLPESSVLRFKMFDCLNIIGGKA